jgi:hypothetical protein
MAPAAATAAGPATATAAVPSDARAVHARFDGQSLSHSMVMKYIWQRMRLHAGTTQLQQQDLSADRS